MVNFKVGDMVSFTNEGFLKSKRNYGNYNEGKLHESEPYLKNGSTHRVCYVEDRVFTSGTLGHRTDYYLQVENIAWTFHPDEWELAHVHFASIEESGKFFN